MQLYDAATQKYRSEVKSVAVKDICKEVKEELKAEVVTEYREG